LIDGHIEWKAVRASRSLKMELLLFILTSALICVAALLVLLVLIQRPKGSKRTETDTPAWHESLWGVHTPRMLRVCTVIAGAVFLGLAVLVAIIMLHT